MKSGFVLPYNFFENIDIISKIDTVLSHIKQVKNWGQRVCLILR